jgi:opacity protein-like surface antigen
MALIGKLLAAAALVLLPAVAEAQASPAIRIPPSLTAGGFYSNFTPDYTPNRLGGLGVYVDMNLFLHNHLGVEGEARWLRFNQQFGSHEDNYLVGPRYSRRYGKFVPYVKFLMGAGELEFPSNQGHGGYFAYAPGGGLDYRLTRHFTIRAIDYEYHRWPSALGGGLPSNGLTPNGFSAGVGYRIF